MTVHSIRIEENGDVERKHTNVTTPADLLAVQRAHADYGRDAALAEIRRRWPDISETVLPATLERILAAPIDQPPRYRQSGEPVLDGRRTTPRKR